MDDFLVSLGDFLAKGRRPKKNTAKFHKNVKLRGGGVDWNADLCFKCNLHIFLEGGWQKKVFANFLFHSFISSELFK